MQQDQEVKYKNSILPMDHRRNNAQDVLRCHLCETPAPPMYCDICNLNLCKLCVGEHLSDESTEHKVVPFRKRGSTLYCSKHSTKLCDLHCVQCDIPICVQCVSSDEHLGHKQKDILKFLENKNEALQKDLKELEKSIYPKYQEIASNIFVQKSDLCENSKKLKTTLDEQGEILHREIDNVIKELKNEVDKIETRYFTVLDKQNDKIKGNISEITQIIADVKKLINSNDVSLVSSYTPKLAEFRRFPPKLKVVLPSLSPQKINKQQIYQQFGSLSAEGITPQDYAFKSNFPRTLSSHQDIMGEEDTSLDRLFDEMQMRHASEARWQTKGASIKQKQLIESAAPQSPYQYPGNFNNPFSSQPHRCPYPAWTTKPSAVHENRKPLKQSFSSQPYRGPYPAWTTKPSAVHENKKPLKQSFSSQPYRGPYPAWTTKPSAVHENKKPLKQSFSSQPYRGPYPAWTTKPGTIHENKKPLKQSFSSQPYRGPYPAWTTKPGTIHENRKPLKQSLGQSHGGSQEGEELQQFECPKCNQTCPDMDTLQIHVLDCIDQDMT